MREVVEELHALADECHEWEHEENRRLPNNADTKDKRVMEEFGRLAKKLDELATHLANMPISPATRNRIATSDSDFDAD